jgi:flavorubredoxin
MSVRSICPDVYFIGINDWDRQVFDALVPLPLGTSYNSYVVKGDQKVAIIDTVEAYKSEEFFERLNQLNLPRVDYVISLHAEQDHSGVIPELIKIYPECQIVTNAKCKDLLESFYHLSSDRIMVVGEGDVLSLGNKTLRFILAPWVHWPDNMFVYLKEDNILFSTDFFGAHIADSNMFVQDKCRVYDAAKRYYAQIMMPFRTHVKNSLKKTEELDLKFIAPSHGQVYDDPKFIMDAYREWSADTVKNEVIVPYVSMHGSTRKMVEYLVDKLIERGITVKPFNLETADTGELAMAMVDAATLVVGSSACLVGPHPKAVYAAYLVNSLRPKTKVVSLIGSYGWGSKLIENVKSLISNIKAEVLDPVVVKGYPTAEGFADLERLADQILEKHKEMGLL